MPALLESPPATAPRAAGRDDSSTLPRKRQANDTPAAGRSNSHTDDDKCVQNEPAPTPSVDAWALADAAEMKLNATIATKGQLFGPVGDRRTIERIRLTALCHLDARDCGGNYRRRTDAAASYQQFSTPAGYALVAAWALSLRKDDVVLEPSAGVGGLACFAAAAGVKGLLLNELEPGRADRLQQWVLDAGLNDRIAVRVSNHDGEQLHVQLPGAFPELLPAGHPGAADGPFRVTAVLMNPPFTRSDRTSGPDGNRKDLHAGARHVESALKVLAPGGRLVAIVGRGMAFGKAAHAGWWHQIMAQHRVRANVGVAGDVYKTRGTSFGTRLLVIDKLAPTTSTTPTPDNRDVVVGEEMQLPEVIDALAGVAADRPRVLPWGHAGKEVTCKSTPKPHSGLFDRPSSTSTATTGSAPSSSNTTAAASAASSAAPTAATSPAPAPSESDSAARPGSSNSPTPASASPLPDPVDAAAAKAAAKRDALSADAVFETYTPQLPDRVAQFEPQTHPTPLVESAAMSAAERTPWGDHPVPPLPVHLIKEGLLSDAQLEAVCLAYKSFAQRLPDGCRRGYLVGDGTGLGKGREAAAMILLDFQHTGRTARQFKKAIWVSKSSKLIEDARRDWADLGGDPNDIFPVTSYKMGEAIDRPGGIAFLTYAGLRSGYATNPSGSRRTHDASRTDKVWDRPRDDRSRLGQLMQWLGRDFDGVIAFDEAHEMRAAISVEGGRGRKQVSQQADAGIDLQYAVPDAQILYLSATGATDVHNLAYATRLGLWGEGTSFPTPEVFVNAIEKGGVAAMELVARDMKTMGAYVARSLSFAGVEYDRLTHVLSPEQREMYDLIARAMQIILQNFDQALELTASVTKEDGTQGVDQKAKAKAHSAFWGAHQRIFNQLVTSLGMPTVLDDVERELEAGNACVLQLVNTNEAAMERQLAKLEDLSSDSLEDVDITPREMIMQLVEHCFPVRQLEQYFDHDSQKMKLRPAVDSDGKPIDNPEAVAMREQLLTDLGAVRVPDGPLEMLLNRFGADHVAEVTGRGRRVVRKNVDGEMRLVPERRNTRKCMAEVREFCDDKRRILVFSQAGGTGASYHADETIKNTRRRIHYLVQPGWVADNAVQGFGRTHRSRQVSAPLYKLVSTDLKGQKRFVSTIARRLDQLGALTKGQRQAAGNDLFKASDNLESPIARDALYTFYRKLHAEGGIAVPREDGVKEIVTLETFEHETGLKLTDNEGNLRMDLPPQTRFLNRILSLTCDRQNVVFDAYHKVLVEKVEAALLDGTLDQGMETIVTKACRIVKDSVVYRDPATGAVTRQTDVEATWDSPRISWDELNSEGTATVGNSILFYAVNTRSERIYAFSRMGSRTDDRGIVIERLRRTDPGGSDPVDKLDALDSDKYRQVPVDEARRLWDEAYENTPTTFTRTLHLITGCVLPIWDRLRGDPRVKRLRTDDGVDLIGRLIPDGELATTRRALGLSAADGEDDGGEDPAAVSAAILDWMETRRGNRPRYELANGLVLRPCVIQGQTHLEVLDAPPSLLPEVRRLGFRTERIDWQTRVICDAADAEAAVKGLASRWPILSRAA